MGSLRSSAPDHDLGHLAAESLADYSTDVLVLVESNTTGTGPLLAQAARREGLVPVLLAADPSRYPFAWEQGVAALPCDTASPAAVLAAVGGLRAAGASVAGVMSSSDHFVARAAAAAAALGLAGPAPDAVAGCQDKGRQSAVLAASGVPAPEHATVSSPAAAVAAANRLGYPVVIKPVAGSGSVGVRRCASAPEVLEHAAGALTGRNERGMAIPRRLLVQAYVEGAEYSVETFGERVVGLTRKRLGGGSHFVEIGHDFPAPLAEPDRSRLRDVTLAALRVLGLGWGPAHVELRLGPAGPTVIEVNPRLAGGLIPELVRASLGIDLVRQTVRAAAGRVPDLEPARARGAAIRFAAVVGPSLVASWEPVAAARGVAGVVDARLYLPVDAVVEPRGDFRDRVGHVLATAGTAEEAARAAERALALLSGAIRPVPSPLPARGGPGPRR